VHRYRVFILLQLWLKNDRKIGRQIGSESVMFMFSRVRSVSRDIIAVCDLGYNLAEDTTPFTKKSGVNWDFWDIANVSVSM
jgi:hypothetical protein